MISKAKELLPQIIKWRRHIHQNPELSFEEHQTAEYIIAVLQSYRINCKRVAGTGVLAQIDGLNPDPEHPVVLRADMDALPIRETTDVHFASHNGAMHACGHDMHTASLLGALVLLKESADKFNGTVLGLFQPAEELHPGGASIVLSEGVFDHLKPRMFIAQHVSPELKVGTFGFRAGQFMASSDEVHITIKGKGGHAAMPHNLNDPVLAQAAVIMAMQSIVSRNSKAMTPTVLSFGRVIADGATNIIPNKIYIEGTFRTMDEAWRADAKQRIRSIASLTAQAYGVEADVEIKDGYPCLYNDEDMTVQAMRIGREEFGDESVVEVDKRMTAEDFGFYSVRYPSLLYRLGVGESAPLHNSAFCPDEQALIYGTAMLAILALKINR